jgi:hypothetical protein
MKRIRIHIAVWLILLIGGFLLGFVPEYRKNLELRTQVEEPQKAINALKRQIQVGELRDAAGLMFLELSRQNYGLARDHVNEYETRLKTLISQTEDEALKKSLEDLFVAGDSLRSSLLTPDPASLTAAEALVRKTFEVTKDSRWGRL